MFYETLQARIKAVKKLESQPKEIKKEIVKEITKEINNNREEKDDLRESDSEE